MVDNTYEPTYNMTWLRAYAQMENPKFVTTAVYPSCTDPLVSLDLSQCTFNSSSGEDSSDVEVQDARMKQGLSTGGKIGIAVGVVVGVVLLLFISLFAYRKYASSQPKKAERTNFQYQEGV
jgi:nucleoside permease NupC